MVLGVEGDGVLRPFEGLRRLNSREGRVELAGKLLELVVGLGARDPPRMQAMTPLGAW